MKLPIAPTLLTLLLCACGGNPGPDAMAGGAASDQHDEAAAASTEAAGRGVTAGASGGNGPGAGEAPGRQRGIATGSTERAGQGTGTGTSSSDWRDDTPAERFARAIPLPEQIEPGTPMADAVAALEARGYEDMIVSGCMMQRDNGGGFKEQVTLGSQSLHAAAARNSVPAMPRAGCSPSPPGRVVSAVGYKQFVPGGNGVDAEAELKALVDRLGDYRECARGTTWCVWPRPGGDAWIDTITVTLANGWGREVAMAANMLEVEPVLPERSDQVDGIVAEAETACSSARPTGSMLGRFTLLRDCSCIARRIGRAYAVGEVDRFNDGLIVKYIDGCLPGADALRAYYTDACLDSRADRQAKRSVAAWALDGGCACVGDTATDMALADPTIDRVGLKGLSGKAETHCGYRQAYKGETPTIPRTASADRAPGIVRTPSGNVYAKGAAFTVLGAGQPGIRPLEIWLKDGVPVFYREDEWTSVTVLDRSFDYAPQNGAFIRFLDLLLLAEDPVLLGDAAHARYVAAETLDENGMDGVLKSCRPGSTPEYCEWDAEGEEAQGALAARFNTDYAGKLQALAKEMPRGFINVERGDLGEYDMARGGFPIDSVGLSDPFMLTPDSLMGYPGPVTAEVRTGIVPSFWKVDEAEGRGIDARLANHNGGSVVFVAVRYRIVDIARNGPDKRGKRHLVLVPEEARLYGDARLTDELAVLPIGAVAAAATDAQ